MKLQILQEDLVKAISLASRFTSTHTQLPVLGNIFLSATKTKLQIASTNLEISTSILLGAKVEKEGEICIPSRILSEIIANLPKTTLSLSSEKEQLKIEADGFSSEILGINSSDFPKVPSKLKENTFSLSQNVFEEKLSKVLFATSSDEARPVLTGVLFRFSKDSLEIVSTDGFRLSRARVNLSGNKTNLDLVIPKTVLSEISRVGEGEDISFGVDKSEKQIVFQVGNVVFTSRIIDGTFPDFEKIIPKSSSSKVKIDKEELLRAIKLAAPFSRDNANIVKLKILKDSIKVVAESSQGGRQEAKVDAKIESKDFEIAFNYKFVEDFLNSVGGEEVQMEFTTPDKAGVFTDTSDPSFLHLIMPVNLQK